MSLIVFAVVVARGAVPVVGPWVPVFQGVDHSVSTNKTPSSDFPHVNVVHALRVDLTDPEIRLLTTPRTSDYVAGSREVGALTVSDFLRTNHLQAAINANFFSGANYYLPPGTPMDVYGLSISKGVLVSAQDGPGRAAVIAFDQSNQPTMIHKNWPGTSVDGIFTAVAGDVVLVNGGRNVAPQSGGLDTHPRTAFGLSQDRRFLYLMTIDGRQPGYSNGALDRETAGWLLLLGAYDGINMDGGGSTTLVMEGTTGDPIRLNRSSAVADSGRERTVGSHLGLFAKPLRGFINDVSVVPEETSAVLSWTTTSPSRGEVQYGASSAFDSRTGVQTDLATRHQAVLNGLAPGTSYYYQVLASANNQSFVSPTFRFSTENHITTNRIFEITHEWRHSTADLDGIGWTEPGYDDSAWEGPAPGLLWVDVRPGGPNPAVEPKNTRLEASSSNNGFPFVTYSFRTHFSLPRIVSGGSLKFAASIDDGAVLYLNGVEIYRLRMPASSTHATLATDFPCVGDATCLDEFTVPFAILGELFPGDNCLAVEVHNYNLRSADVTFGLSLSALEPLERKTRIDIQVVAGGIQLSWIGSGFVVQSASALQGPWISVEGTGANPLLIKPSETTKFYRLSN